MPHNMIILYFLLLISMSQRVLYFLQSTSVFSFCIEVILTLCIYREKSYRLTHDGLVIPYGIIKLGHHWFRVLASTKPLPEPILTYCWMLGNKIQWNIIPSMKLVIVENKFENILKCRQFCSGINVLKIKDLEKNYPFSIRKAPNNQNVP